jgi:hypothetical protein
MFRATNFTESNQSYRSTEGEMRIAARLWSHFHGKGARTREDRSRESYKFAWDAYDELVGPRPEGSQVTGLNQEQKGIWMMQGIVADAYSEWAENAFPRVQTSHSFAAMLMATTISVKELEHVNAPWSAFVVEIPENLLPVQAQGIDSSITRLLINTHYMPSAFPERWWTISLYGHRIELHRAGTLLDLVTEKNPPENVPLTHVRNELRTEVRDAPLEEPDAFWEDMYSRSQEDRITQLAVRLMVGVCTLMTEKANYTQRTVDLDKKIGKDLTDPRRKVYAERQEKLPESRIYLLGKPVKIDLRLAVRAFVEGRSKGPMTIQRLVAGHHKNQPHGPGNSLRKWIFIEPYWQGPSDAAIVVRPHHG